MNGIREPLRASDPMDSGNSETSIRIETRVEQAGDAESIYQGNSTAFGQTEEAELVNVLRKHCSERLSLVALNKGKIVGHILFSAVSVRGDRGMVRGMARYRPEFGRVGAS